MSGRVAALLEVLRERGTINLQVDDASTLIALGYAVLVKVEQDGSYTLDITKAGGKTNG